MTSQGGTTQIGAANPDGSGAHLLTNDAAGASQPSLSPDGTQLVYGSYDGSHGGYVIKLLNIAAGTTTELANGTDPSWRPLRSQYVDHIYGTGGVSNDAAASRWQFNTVGKYTPGLLTAYNAVLVNKYDATDAALGVELAGEKQAPLLMTSGNSLDPAAAAELRRVMHRGWTVYLEGNTSVLSAHVAAQVQALGLRVVRVGGSGATGQSVTTARTLTATPTWVVLADSLDYRVPASAATLAASAGYHGRIVVAPTGTGAAQSLLTGR
ncbi:TolB family protein [Streptacidiphilus sp. MAP12-20]|uniref:TolB family protein n=1 Tax=Streptacidiphilus sp. MAP12-20 TaxID=3156299 RepID=UPI0035140182